MDKFHLLQSLLATLPLIKNRIRDYYKSFNKRGFFPAGVAIFAIFLLVISVLGYGLNLKPLTVTIKAPVPVQGFFAESPKNFLIEAPAMSFLQKNSLIGISSPVTITSQTLGTVLGDEEEPREEIIEYTVKEGDTLSGIADNFGISLETVLWANDLSSGSTVKVGQKLIILPVSGVVYHVQKGDTLSQIAKDYKGNVEEIIAFNELSNEGDIFIGDILIIPGGKMPKTSQPSSYVSIPLGSSYFICPHNACRITQGLHWYNAIDFGGKCGDPLFAAAAGTVQRIRYGWNGGAGNYLTILHPNGVVTMYGHLQTVLVSVGQSVSQGDIIAFMGGQPGTPGAGNSTGCHVHFEVIGARNPFAK